VGQGKNEHGWCGLKSATRTNCECIKRSRMVATAQMLPGGSGQSHTGEIAARQMGEGGSVFILSLTQISIQV
jgi:hypothetical protein